MGFFILVIAASVLQFAIAQRDYCAVTSCSANPHVGCPIPTIPTTSSCTAFTAITYDAVEITSLLARHNERRNMVASGIGISDPAMSAPWFLPAATDIKKLVWNDELALLASYNVRQCIMNHDACRNTDVYNGQNLYQYRSRGLLAGSVSPTIVIDRAVNSWYNEINLFDEEQIDSFTGNNGVGGFTQVIWANTQRLGCAGAKWNDGDSNPNWTYLIVCNYGPGGNYVGNKIYTKGLAGSSCTTRDLIYLSLCV